MAPSLSNYKTIHYHESWGQETLGLQVLFSGPINPRDSEKLRILADRFSEEFLEEARLFMKENNEDENRARLETIIKLKFCFPDRNFECEQIPNEYCNKSCCYTKPWLSMLTPKGPIKIGWRKRVINIDWRGLILPYRIDSKIFNDQDTTHGNYYVHAWSYEKAREYIAKILK